MKFKTFISIFTTVFMLTLVSVDSNAAITGKLPVDNFSTKYDAHFKKASKRYFGITMDWRWFKSQGMAESALNKDAISPVGAKGVLQIMPGTWKDITRQTGITSSINNARWNIQAGVYYDRQLYKQWKSRRPELDRMALVMASYNAGLGNPLKAQRVCIAVGESNCNLWSSIKAQAPNVRSWKHEETLGYVTRIFKFMGYKNY